MNMVSAWATSTSAVSRARCASPMCRRRSSGDYAIVHAGFAISTVDEEEAARTLELAREIETRLAEEDAS